MTISSKHVHDLVLAALFLNLGLVLPFFTGNIPAFGAMLLPMHLPVLLCGIILGPRYGALVGLILPITRFFMIGMPPLMPTAISMTTELAAYGGVIGILYGRLPKTVPYLYASLIGAMLAGRLVWAGSRVLLLGLRDIPFSFELFLAGAFANAIPGIVLQIIFIPTMIYVLKKVGWQNGARINA